LGGVKLTKHFLEIQNISLFRGKLVGRPDWSKNSFRSFEVYFFYCHPDPPLPFKIQSSVSHLVLLPIPCPGRKPSAPPAPLAQTLSDTKRRCGTTCPVLPAATGLGFDVWDSEFRASNSRGCRKEDLGLVEYDRVLGVSFRRLYATALFSGQPHDYVAGAAKIGEVPGGTPRIIFPEFKNVNPIP